MHANGNPCSTNHPAWSTPLSRSNTGSVGSPVSGSISKTGWLKVSTTCGNTILRYGCGISLIGLSTPAANVTSRRSTLMCHRSSCTNSPLEIASVMACCSALSYRAPIRSPYPSLSSFDMAVGLMDFLFCIVGSSNKNLSGTQNFSRMYRLSPNLCGLPVGST